MLTGTLVLSVSTVVAGAQGPFVEVGGQIKGCAALNVHSESGGKLGAPSFETLQIMLAPEGAVNPTSAWMEMVDATGVPAGVVSEAGLAVSSTIGGVSWNVAGTVV
jgi:hypothetical protein